MPQQYFLFCTHAENNLFHYKVHTVNASKETSIWKETWKDEGE